MTLPTDDIPWDDITAWLAGTLPAAQEAERLQQWVAEDPTRRKFLHSMHLLWDGAAQARPSWNTRAALDAIKQRSAERHVVPLTPRFTPPVSAPHRRLRNTFVAAAAAAGIFAGGWWLAGKAASKSVPYAAVPAPALRHYETARGQRLAFKLPDGSSVMLGPESAVRYAPAYGKHDRVVELQGVAAFEVTHDAARPFEVRTAYAVARDLGTRFVVRAYRTAPSVEVVVAKGRVALSAVRPPRRSATTPLAKSLVLDRGDWGQVLATGDLTSRHGVPLDQYFGWTEGRLVFDSTNLADIVAELNRWYDVDIRLADSTVGRLRLTATFPADQPITEVLSSIQASLRLELSGTGRHFTLAVR